MSETKRRNGKAMLTREAAEGICLQATNENTGNILAVVETWEWGEEQADYYLGEGIRITESEFEMLMRGYNSGYSSCLNALPCPVMTGKVIEPMLERIMEKYNEMPEEQQLRQELRKLLTGLARDVENGEFFYTIEYSEDTAESFALGYQQALERKSAIVA